MAACHKELAMYIGVDHRDHALIIRQLNFEIVADLNYSTALTSHSTFHIDHIAVVQIELVIVVGQLLAAANEINFDYRFLGGYHLLCRLGLLLLLLLVMICCKSNDFECHDKSLLQKCFFFFGCIRCIHSTG